jgi:hypothetical protein
MARRPPDQFARGVYWAGKAAPQPQERGRLGGEGMRPDDGRVGDGGGAGSPGRGGTGAQEVRADGGEGG